MNSLSRRKKHWHLLVSVTAVAIGLHFAVFVVLGWFLLLTQESAKGSEVEEPAEQVEISIASLEALREQIYPSPEELLPLPKPEEDEEEKQEDPERQMMETDGLLAQEKSPDDPAFESDKNTRAASELPRSVTSKDKPLPNQKGELFERSPSLRDSKFTEEQEAPEPVPQLENQADRDAMEKKGESEDLQPEPEPSPEPSPDPQPQPEAVPEDSSKGMEPEESTDSLLPVPSEKIRPIPDEEDEPEKSLGDDEKANPEKPEKDLREEAEEKSDPAKPDKGKPDAKSEEDQKASQANKPKRQLQSFSSERRKSQISGSISRKGASSVDAVNTPMGRYWKSISKAVETVWQREARKYRDFNMPGSLRIAFNVDKRGVVSNLRIISDAGVATIQKGYTIRAINEAKIPAMPSDLISEMEGEPVEMIITFNY